MKLFCYLALLILLPSCTSVPSIEIDGAYENINPSYSEPPLHSAPIEQDIVDSLIDPSLFDVAVEKTDLSVFLQGLVMDTPYNIVVHPDVTRSVSLELKQVTVIDVLKVVRDLFDLHLKIDGNFISVMPNTMETRIFSLNYVNISREGVSDMRVSTGSIKDAGASGNNSDNSQNANSDQGSQASEIVGSRVTTENSTDLWSGMKDAIQGMMAQGGDRKITVMEQAGIIVVRALRSELKIVSEFLLATEYSLQRQVVLEAKILEVVLSDRFERGIDWAAIGNIGGLKGGPYEVGLSSNPLVNPDGLDGVFSASVNLSDFGGIIELLESQGQVRVLSSPRIATVNNQKAVIKVGTDEFFVTNVSSTTTTGTSTTTTPSVTLTPFFSGIALDVTPQISQSGEVILHIHPTVSEVTDQNKVVTVGNDTVSLPLALSTIRESDSIVKAKNGQVIVIGGLMKNVSKTSRAGLPLLGRVPLFDSVFSQKRTESLRSELVILVRPIVADTEFQERDVLDSLERVRDLGVR
ncbi:MAG: MSHA biogenesis protein MshL [Candidatus Azotimanducaceae bacterium]|jgi:MSHA biogenesis protein MshL